MLHRIAGAFLLVFVGVLIAFKYQNFTRSHLGPNGPTGLSAESELLTPLSTEAVKAQVQTGDHKLSLINFWASWCVPCQKEFPAILSLREELKDQGLQVILISADQENKRAAAEEFLIKMKVDFKSYYRGNQGYKAMDEIYPGWNGALPASLIVGKDGQILDAWFGETSAEEFKSRIGKHLF